MNNFEYAVQKSIAHKFTESGIKNKLRLADFYN